MRKTKEIKVKDAEVVLKEKTQTYIFVKKFETHNKTYYIGDKCKQKNEDVIKYLLTNKIIK
jgi:hypothetical protein